MTLIINEIRLVDGFADAYWICAADRNLSNNGKLITKRKKIFPIKYLNATISFFGLGFWKIGTKEIYMSDILKSFITQNNSLSTLDDFAEKLRNHLNSKIPEVLINEVPTGFHLSGFDQNQWPHFIHFSNVMKMEGMKYTEWGCQFKEPFCDFQQRDAIEHLGWDKENPHSARNEGFIYRNGDIRLHVHTSNEFDRMMAKVFDQKDFFNLDSIEKRANYLLYKFNFISSFYEKWTNNNLIGKPIDIYIIKKNEILELKNKTWQKLI